jgi:KTSC domain
VKSNGMHRCTGGTWRPDRPKFDASILIEDSSWVDSIQYDAETFVLDAMLTSGKRYRYRDVSPMTFARIVTAKSSGQAFNQYLKPLKHKTLPRRK